MTKTKRQQSEQIKKEIADFKAAGGVINRLNITERAEALTPMQKNRKHQLKRNGR
jgi:hypothetical protein